MTINYGGLHTSNIKLGNTLGNPAYEAPMSRKPSNNYVFYRISNYNLGSLG